MYDINSVLDNGGTDRSSDAPTDGFFLLKLLPLPNLRRCSRHHRHTAAPVLVPIVMGLWDRLTRAAAATATAGAKNSYYAIVGRVG